MSGVGPELAADLLARWRQPHRRHHNEEHLREVLDALEVLARDGVVFDREPVVLAAWFHDAVYEIGRDDNEARSADLALRMLDGALADEVARLVLTTTTHKPAPGDANGAALSDADLSVLGAGRERYQRYARAVREEYAAIPEPEFNAGRARIMAALLDRGPIYATAAGRARWERQAVENVTAEIAALTGVRTAE